LPFLQSKMVGVADKATFKRARKASKVGQHPAPTAHPLLRPPSRLLPVAVPEKICGLTLSLIFSTAATPFCSLFLPPAALATFPHEPTVLAFESLKA
jgi:hypothetical protein